MNWNARKLLALVMALAMLLSVFAAAEDIGQAIDLGGEIVIGGEEGDDTQGEGGEQDLELGEGMEGEQDIELGVDVDTLDCLRFHNTILLSNGIERNAGKVNLFQRRIKFRSDTVHIVFGVAFQHPFSNKGDCKISLLPIVHASRKVKVALCSFSQIHCAADISGRLTTLNICQPFTRSLSTFLHQSFQHLHRGRMAWQFHFEDILFPTIFT